MKLHWLNTFLENIRKLEKISILDVSAYEQTSFHIKRAYRGAFRKTTTRMKRTGMTMGRRPRIERDIVSNHNRV